MSLGEDVPLLAQMAEKKGVSPEALCLAYFRQKWPCILHIVGCRQLKNLQDIVKAHAVALTQEEINALDNAKPTRRK